MESSEEMIELLVASVSRDTTDHNRKVFRDALWKLVRLAQSEKMTELQIDFQVVEQAASQNYRG
ncbi:MAG: hypothetical protein ACRYGK_01780 [Janthinobacterium lividum]